MNVILSKQIIQHFYMPHQSRIVSTNLFSSRGKTIHGKFLLRREISAETLQTQWKNLQEINLQKLKVTIQKRQWQKWRKHVLRNHQKRWLRMLPRKPKSQWLWNYQRQKRSFNFGRYASRKYWNLFRSYLGIWRNFRLSGNNFGLWIAYKYLYQSKTWNRCSWKTKGLLC